MRNFVGAGIGDNLSVVGMMEEVVMNSKQANKVKHLVAGVNEVLEGLEWECGVCNGSGIGVVGGDGRVDITRICPVCKGTRKIPYSWQLQVGDKVCRGNMILFYAGIIRAIKGKRAGKFISMSGEEYEWPIDIVTYIPGWETIEEILEKAGLRIDIDEYDKGYNCTIIAGGSKKMAAVYGKSRQEAVMLAVIKLGKEMKHESKSSVNQG